MVKQDGVFVCQSCGSKYSVEEAKKMMVTIDNSDKLENALKNARRAKESGDFQQAEKYYEIALMEDADNWEAIFYTAYLKAMKCSVAEIAPAADFVAKHIKTVLESIKKIEDNAQQNEAVKQINADLSALSLMLHNAAINTYNTLVNPSIKNAEDYSVPVFYSAGMLLTFGDELVSEFGENDFTTPIIIECYDTSLGRLYNAFEAKYISDEFFSQYVEKLKKLKPSYNSPKEIGETMKKEEKEKAEKAKKEAEKGWWKGCLILIGIIMIFGIIVGKCAQ